MMLKVMLDGVCPSTGETKVWEKSEHALEIGSKLIPYFILSNF
jgi:hypothetical protein